MSQQIKRVIESAGEPSYNDLWLDPRGDVPGLKTFRGGKWVGVDNTNLQPIREDISELQGAVNTLSTSKVDKVTGKGLSTNDFTNELKMKYNNAAPSTLGTDGQVISLQSGAPTWVDPTEGSIIDTELSGDSTNPVQNKVITSAISQLGQYVDNTEWVKVVTDSEDKILYGVKTDGKFYFGGGCPPQVKEYVQEQLDSHNIDDIETFLGSLIEGDTLATLLNAKANASDVSTSLATKVDKVAGKSLIDEDFASALSHEDNELLYTILDSTGRVVASVDKDGVLQHKEKEKNGILDYNQMYAVKPLITNYKFWDYEWGEGIHESGSPLTLLWFSDIHGNRKNLSRIASFYNLLKNDKNNNILIDDVISTGDSVEGVWANDYGFWWMSGAQTFLPVIGNHDAWGGVVGGKRDWVSQQQCYNKFFKPNIEGGYLDITMGTDDGSFQPPINHCYWYKDYSFAISEECPGGIRLVALDLYHWRELRPDTAPSRTVYDDGTSVDTGQQHDWFVEILEDAKEKKLAVMVAIHAPASNVDFVNCPFSSLDPINNAQSESIKSEMLADVQDFIDAGGEFICWMTGHVHQDWFGNIHEYPNQTIITIDTGADDMMWRSVPMVDNTKSEDKFNIISIEPRKKYIRLHRIGSEYDRHGRHIGSMVYDYKNKTIISNI